MEAVKPLRDGILLKEEHYWVWILKIYNLVLLSVCPLCFVSVVENMISPLNAQAAYRPVPITIIDSQ